MTRDAFERLVEEGFALLPEKFRKSVRNVAFLVEDLPSEQVRKDAGLGAGETLLGFYQGVPNTARGESYGVGPTLPDTIFIYQKPTEEVAQEMLEDASAHNLPPDASEEAFKEAVRQVVADTVWHEVAHYFGMDEEAVSAKEEKRSRSHEKGCN